MAVSCGRSEGVMIRRRLHLRSASQRVYEMLAADRPPSATQRMSSAGSALTRLTVLMGASHRQAETFPPKTRTGP